MKHPTGTRRMHPKVWFGLLSALLAVVSHSTISRAQNPGTFTPTGNMTTARYWHTATALIDGKVLIAGGSDIVAAEIYDPSNGTFVATGEMSGARYGHTATLLPDGKVLIAGGRLVNGAVLASAEVYDPSTGTFAATGDMGTARYNHTATLLNNGKVLIAGGETSDYLKAAGAELYDPSTGVFDAAGGYAGTDTLYPEAGGPLEPTATLLPYGKVLIAGVNPAELYDPRSDSFSLTGTMTTSAYAYGMYGHTATLLMNGRVLVAGGRDDLSEPFGSAELYDPTTGRFVDAGVMSARYFHTSTLLTDGTVLLAGGGSGSIRNQSADLYDPRTGTFEFTAYMGERRSGHTATLLQNGTVLITGGFVSLPNGILSTGEIYLPQFTLPALVVTDLQFDRTEVIEGTSYSSIFSGSNLTPETLFDVRYSTPVSNEYDVVLNWQQGTSVNQSVPAGTALGVWTIYGVRAHRDESDHTGFFTPVSASITVSR